VSENPDLQNYGKCKVQHSVFLTCNFLQKVLAKNNCGDYDSAKEVDELEFDRHVG